MQGLHMRAQPWVARPSTSVLEPPDPGTGRVAAAVITGAFFATMVALHVALWQVVSYEDGDLGPVVSLLPFAWIVAVPSTLIGLVGLFLGRARDTSWRHPMPDLEVSFRIVTRGQNAEALRATVANVRAEMALRPRFRYRVEVVTDQHVEMEPAADLHQIVVPAGYRTPRGTLFKARALQYALRASSLQDSDWIMHLDEESQVTGSAIDGIARAIREEEASGEHRIGQGAILYHRDLARNKLLTLADMIRTGDDVGRFRLQHRVGQTLFGLHGSFILVRNSVEKEVGFDFGPLGSITEDAFWALLQMDRGRRSRWVDGYVAEQPPRSVLDFLRQRRRWFIGLVLIALGGPVRWRYRAALGALVGLWAVSWIGVALCWVNLALAIPSPLWVALLADLALAYHVALYVIGLRVNLHASGRSGPSTLGLYLQQVVLIPLFSVMEAGAVAYGTLKPDTGFHVVRK
jgi:beta-1,4-mannosyltransferase